MPAPTLHMFLLLALVLADLSIIDHVWSIMGRALQPIRDVNDLTRQLDRICHDIPQEDMHNLYQSMTSRIIACIRTRGGQTGY
ncbi:hypothetical protein X975_09261, partial [Stegodyphus mimosarum]